MFSLFFCNLNLVENQFSCSIKQFQCDGGGEYMSTQFKKKLVTHGILHHISCPHTPQQNGVAECKHRHIMEMRLSLLAQSHLSSIFWVDTFATSVFIINRLPSPIIDNVSPYFKLFNKSPYYSPFRSFGCSCFPLLRPYSTHKLMFRSKHCIFLGYSNNHRGYRYLDPISRKVYVSRHVVFDESRFPAENGVLSPATPGSVSSVSFPIFSNIPSSSSVQIQHVNTDTPPALHASSSPLPSDTSLPISSHDLSPALQVSSPIISSSSPQDSSQHVESSDPIISPPPDTSLAPISIHSMLTRSKTGNLRTRSFPNYTSFYSTKHPLCALSSVSLPPEPTCYSEAAKSHEWRAAMGDEFDALIANQTWSLCPRPSNHNIIRNKWVYKIKEKQDGSIDRYKAKLVAKGFDQESGVDFTETFSPMVKPSTIRVLLALAVQFNWNIHQLDVSNTFLHDHLLEEVYMEQPRGFIDPQFPSHVCRLHKSLYGLKQAPRAWFTRLSQTLLELGFVSSSVDNSLFILHRGNVHLYLLIYVDDILFTGTSTSHIASVITQLQQVFKLKDLGNLHFFLGIQAVRSSQGLHLRQSKYISDLLSKSNMLGAKPYSSPCLVGSKMSTVDGDPLCPTHITTYRQTVGALQYCTLTRPNIAFSVNQLY